jgi:hypothetical protein
MTDDRRDCGFGKDESRRISGSKPEIEQPARVMQAAGEILELCMTVVLYHVRRHQRHRRHESGKTGEDSSRSPKPMRR